MKNTASRCRGYFYPRSPCGERRLSYFYIIKITQFLSTLSLRRATIPDREPAAGYLISIHALLAESDPTRWAPTCRISNFYPRSPCGERPSLLYSSSCIHRFLSTLSLRRATTKAQDEYKDTVTISIHALLAESDHFPGAHLVGNSQFLSTLSLRRATIYCHLLRTSYSNFYPRSPCGERPRWARSHRQPSADFYPRSPCGERRGESNCAYLPGCISIHALLAESDSSPTGGQLGTVYFYPRSPCGERREYWVGGYGTANNFYPRSPCGERQMMVKGTDLSILFLSTLSLRRATGLDVTIIGRTWISIHALLAESDGRQQGRRRIF